MTTNEIDKLREELELLRAQYEQETEQLREENKEVQERVDALEDDKERIEKEKRELRSHMAELETTNEQLQADINDFEPRVGELETTIDAQPEITIADERNPIGSLSIAGAPVGPRITNSITQNDWEGTLRPQLVADIEATTTAEEPDTPSGAGDKLTDIERISKVAGDDINSVTDSVAARRAIALWRNLPEWGTKTPKGYCLRPKDNPKRLLEADQDEDLAWKQYYRAAETLESLSEGAATFFDSDKHGKMLVLHEQSEAFDRVRASLTTSTAHAEG